MAQSPTLLVPPWVHQDDGAGVSAPRLRRARVPCYPYAHEDAVEGVPGEGGACEGEAAPRVAKGVLGTEGLTPQLDRPVLI